MISHKQWTALLLVYILYLVIGAFVFVKTERSSEIENLKLLHTSQRRLTMVSSLIEDEALRSEIQNSIQALEEQLGKNLLLPQSYQNLIIARIKKARDQNNNLTYNELILTTFPSNLLDYTDNGTLVTGDLGSELLEELIIEDEAASAAAEAKAMWNFWNSFFFVFTAITTIGYGHMSPHTSSGKVFCLVYAFFGVAFNGILFAGLADLLSHKYIAKIDGKRYEHKILVVVDAILYLIPGIIVLFIIPAFVFMHVENWDYISSIYFTFITLSTIGFGDHVSGNQDIDGFWNWIYKIFIHLWILFGLAYLLVIISFVQRALRSKQLRVLDRKMAKILKKRKAKKANLQSDLEKLGSVLRTISTFHIPQRDFATQNENPLVFLDSQTPQKNGGIINFSYEKDIITEENEESPTKPHRKSIEDAASVEIFLQLAKTVLSEAESLEKDISDENIETEAEANDKGQCPKAITDAETGEDDTEPLSRKLSIKRKISEWTSNTLSDAVVKIAQVTQPSESSSVSNENENDDESEEEIIDNFGDLVEKVRNLLSQEIKEARKRAIFNERQRSSSMFANAQDHHYLTVTKDGLTIKLDSSLFYCNSPF